MSNLLETYVKKNQLLLVFCGTSVLLKTQRLLIIKYPIKKYTEKKLKGIYEVTNATGTVGAFEGKPLVHIHASLSDEKMIGLGGHLVKAVVSATLEVVLQTFDKKVDKKFNPGIGLKLFDLSKELS